MRMRIYHQEVRTLTHAMVTLLAPLPPSSPLILLILRLFLLILIHNEPFPYPPLLFLVFLWLFRAVVGGAMWRDFITFFFLMTTPLHRIVLVVAWPVLDFADWGGHGGKRGRAWR